MFLYWLTYSMVSENCKVQLTQSYRKTPCELTCAGPGWCEPVAKKKQSNCFNVFNSEHSPRNRFAALSQIKFSKGRMTKILLTELGRTVREDIWICVKDVRSSFCSVRTSWPGAKYYFSFGPPTQSTRLYISLLASGAGGTDLSVGMIVGITIGSAVFITLLIVLLVWLVRRQVNGKQPSTLDYQSLHKYNSLVSECFTLQLNGWSPFKEDDQRW